MLFVTKDICQPNKRQH